LSLLQKAEVSDGYSFYFTKLTQVKWIWCVMRYN